MVSAVYGGLNITFSQVINPLLTGAIATLDIKFVYIDERSVFQLSRSVQSSSVTYDHLDTDISSRQGLSLSLV